MMDDLTAIIIVAIVILGPIWLTFQFLARGRRGLNPQDQAAVQQLSATAQRMEERLRALEQILDAEVPSWRYRFEEAGRPK